MPKRKIKKISFHPLFILNFLILSSFLFLVSFKKIENFVVEPPESLPLVEKYFANKSLLFILLNHKKVFKENPNLVSLEIKPLIYPYGIKIKIKEGKVLAKIIDFKENKIYFLDNYERINSYFKPKEKKILEIISYKKIEDRAYLNKKIFNFLLKILQFSNLYLVKIDKLIIHSNFDISLILENNQEYLFDLQKNQDEQIKKFYFFLEFQKKQNFKAFRVDLRIPKKIYFQ